MDENGNIFHLWGEFNYTPKKIEENRKYHMHEHTKYNKTRSSAQNKEKVIYLSRQDDEILDVLKQNKTRITTSCYLIKSPGE